MRLRRREEVDSQRRERGREKKGPFEEDKKFEDVRVFWSIQVRVFTFYF